MDDRNCWRWVQAQVMLSLYQTCHFKFGLCIKLLPQNLSNARQTRLFLLIVLYIQFVDMCGVYNVTLNKKKV